MTTTATRKPDDHAARYLLGLLPDAERERWEEGLLSDRHAFDATLAAEDDLVDAYARGELGRRERTAFERSLLVRGRVGERLAFARALAAATGRPAEDARRAAGLGREPRRPATPWASRWAAAAAIVLLAGAAGVLGWRGSQLAGRLAEVESRADAGQGERARLGEERDRLAARLEAERQERAAERAARAREVAEAERALVAQRDRGDQLAGEVERLRRSTPPRATAVSYLLAAATRGEGLPELRLPPETGRVLLQLDTGHSEPYAAYRATLLAPPGGQVAWSRTGIEPAAGSGRPAVELDLPAEIFVSGRYELLLDGIRPEEPEPKLVEAFEFEVVRP